MLRKFIPSPLLKLYHWVLARLSVLWYGNPSKDMVVIGVTGTAGKTTTINLISQLLEGAGYKTGFTSTAEFKVADKQWLNDKKMTMLGRFQAQKMLKDMVVADCRYALIETSSQGIEQYRHAGIHYDVAVLTNLFPEHIEAHHSFENYKNAKLKFFKHLESGQHKVIDNKTIPKVIAVNFDVVKRPYEDEAQYNAFEFLRFSADKKMVFGIYNKMDLAGTDEVVAENVNIGKGIIEFTVRGVYFKVPLWGEFNVYNCLSAITVGLSQGIGLEKMAKILKNVKPLPGKMEEINEGQNFKVIVDYAFEPTALSKIYELLNIEKKGKIISVLGSCGGGRDAARRPKLGALAAKNADVIIVTNEDPYDDDPQEIINDVASGAGDHHNALKIIDRREAIAKAIRMAAEGDTVLITGKGCEQAMAVQGGKLIPWDDRKVAREEIRKLVS